jgi:hypothetical protein
MNGNENAPITDKHEAKKQNYMTNYTNEERGTSKFSSNNEEF